MSTGGEQQRAAKEPIITIGAVFAFYVVIEGLLRAYEWSVGHHLETTDDSSTWLRALSIGGNLFFGGHFLYSAWESRRVAGLVLAGAAFIAAGYGVYLWASNLPEQGRRYIENFQNMPDGTVFPDPYDHGRLKRKESWGITPYNGPFDTTRPEPCISPNIPIGCQPF